MANSMVCHLESDASRFGNPRESHIFRDLVLIAKISSHIENEFNEHLEWASPIIDDSLALWLRLESPVFLSLALNKCNHQRDLFACVADIREKARPIREMLQTLTSTTSQREARKAALEMRKISYELAKTQPKPSDTKVSLGIGLPISASFGIDVLTKNKSRFVSFIRDIYDNYAIPYALYEDLKRCFRFEKVQHLTEMSVPDLSDGDNLLSRVIYSVKGKKN
jgi:hypothetical protein